MAEPKELGTLVIVVGKARNLPNLARFGKQDPYCTIAIGNEKKKTEPIKRGGQHPEWDTELRFTIMQDADDILAASAAEAEANSLRRKPDGLPPLPTEAQQGVVTPATLASKSRQTKPGKKVGKTMRISAYADDPKAPELIGEVNASFDAVLSEGEVDEWYQLEKQGKYCGEIYLEMTYFSNAVPPVKRDAPRPATYNAHHGPIRPQIQSAATGMNLYIPPYGKQAAPGLNPSPPGLPLPPSQTIGGRLTHSASFNELGLPPAQNGPGHVPGQPGYPPGSRLSMSPVDAIAGSMNSMSLGPSYRHGQPPAAGQPPLPQPVSFPQAAPAPGHGPRHSLSGQSDAPWASLQQPSHQSSPGQRPVSAQDASYGHMDQRMNGSHTVSPAPMLHNNAIPPAHHIRNDSAASLGVPVPGQYPIQPPVSAPYQQQPDPYTPPANRRHSSYGPNYGETPPQAPYQSPAQPPYGQSPGQPPYQPPRHQSYEQPYTQSEYPPVPPPPPAKQPSFGTPGAQSPYQQPSRNDSFNNSPAVPGSYPGQYPPQHTSSHPPPQHQNSAPTPLPNSPPPSTSTGTYVPWYMQTQGQGQPQTPPTSTPYGTPGAASQPRPPAPLPPRPGGGYYPSDELYAQNHGSPQPPKQPTPPQSNYGHASPSQPHHPSPSSQHPSGQFPQTYNPQGQAYAPAPPQSSYNASSAGASPGAPPQTEAPWSNLQQHQPAQPYSNSSTAQPTSQTAYYAQQNADFRPATAAPQGWNSTVGSTPGRAPSPLPPGGGSGSNRDWRSYLSSLSSNSVESPPPPLPPRVPSPQPPPHPYATGSAQGTPTRPGQQPQQDWYNTPPPPVPASIGDYSAPQQPQWR